ncbi:hypothetical protein EGI26_08265 [Lacihabitans sp. CCS-44]|uniref:hypothetical protein n=1 Tax=Lacihabitans sp. CCS-44 TaxID=2487331 RepID=UPI0020CB8B55|nr:hypothetical protein [Lacihabitans sp. CCS-44]MCP9755144.1 hypothetical protein [Lacihabitans sp. CCS-44]
MSSNLIPKEVSKIIEKVVLIFLKYLITVGFYAFLVFVVIHLVEIYFDIGEEKVDPLIAKYIPNVKYWILSVFCIVIVMTFIGYFLPDNNSENETKLISKIKKDYYDSILKNITLSIDNELEKILQKQKFDEAEVLIREKFESFKNIIEIFTGKQSGVLKGTDINTVASFYESTANRIDNEINRQKSLSWLNLFVGLITTFVAILFLILSLPKSLSNLTELLPRVSITLLIEVFSFYFLNLYRRNQDEIKFWNNEKTNLDIKLFALGIAADDEEVGEKTFMQGIVLELLKTERNNILKKEDTTVEIERAKLENLGFENFVNKLTKILEKLSFRK